MAVAISVIVCTYNRADLLINVLRDLCQQTLADTEYEIIVVDNNSSDHTRAVTTDYCQRHPNVRYCLETRIGLSHARNRGWQEASGEYAAYTDDDCQIPPQWLSLGKEIIEQHSPAAFGGPNYPFYNTPKPAWFQDRYAGHIISRQARFLTQDEYLDGMNMFFRKSVFQRIGGFCVDLGMTGKKIAYGEETELLLRIRKMLPESLIFYDPHLFLYHLVRPEKMTIRWIVRQRFADGRYIPLVFKSDSLKTIPMSHLLRGTLQTLLYLGRELTIGLMKRDREQYPFAENYIFERIVQHVRTLGRFYEIFQQKRSR